MASPCNLCIAALAEIPGGPESGECGMRRATLCSPTLAHSTFRIVHWVA